MSVRVGPGVMLACMITAGCSPRPGAQGQIVTAVTVDWEGAYFSPEGLDALDALRAAEPAVPVTHFVSVGYFTKSEPDPEAAASLRVAVDVGDEVAVHVHAWRSLAVAAGVEPKLSPSFLTGTDKLVDLDDGDAGFDTDLDVYSAGELRRLVRRSRELLVRAGVTPSTAFRAGGYLGTPRVLQAIRDEGFTIDSSAIDARQIEAGAGEVFASRVAEIWSDVDPTTQPWLVSLHGGALLELPLAAVADYATTHEILGVFEAARARLARDPDHDVFVVIGFHQETAGEFAGRIREALDAVHARPDLAEVVTFMTVTQAGARASAMLRLASP